MLYHRSFPSRRDGGPRNSGDHGIRYTLLRRRYAKMTMYMYAARFGPNRPHARADAEQALDGFFDAFHRRRRVG